MSSKTWLTKRPPHSPDLCSLSRQQSHMKQETETSDIAQAHFHEIGGSLKSLSLPPNTIFPPYRPLDECIQRAINFDPGRFPQFLVEGKCKLLVDIADGTVQPAPWDVDKLFKGNSNPDSQNSLSALGSNAADTQGTQASPYEKSILSQDCVDGHFVNLGRSFRCRISWTRKQKGRSMSLPTIPLFCKASGSETTPIVFEEHDIRIAEVLELHLDGRKGERRFPVALNWKVIETARAKVQAKIPMSQNLTSRWASHMPRHIGSTKNTQDFGHGQDHSSAPSQKCGQSTSRQPLNKGTVLSLNQWHSKEGLLGLVPNENPSNQTRDQSTGSQTPLRRASTIPLPIESGKGSDSESSVDPGPKGPPCEINARENTQNADEKLCVHVLKSRNVVTTSTLSTIPEEETKEE